MAKETLGYVELFWVCPNCNAKNPGTQRTCQSCGSPQPENVQFQQETQAEFIQDQQKIDLAKEGADIHCPYCGARNPASNKICVQCGGDISEGKRRESGQVLGAFGQGEIKQIPCPACGTMNPENAMRCSQCGASLASAPAQTAPPVVPSRKLSPTMTIAGIIIALILCGICAWLGSGYFKTEDVRGTVSQVHWARSVEVLGFGPVQKEGWKEEIPSAADLGTCSSRFHYESDSAPPSGQATKVCGTPYTVDKGSGVGEVVTDCSFQVYDQYCQYRVDEWHSVDSITSEGDDLNPVWPEPPSSSDRKPGDRSETYTIVFETSNGNYNYTTKDAAEFSRFSPGSRWILNINQFNTILSVKEE